MARIMKAAVLAASLFVIAPANAGMTNSASPNDTARFLAGLQPSAVGYVNAHGTSTPIGDVLEAHAIRNFFGDHKVAISSTKSMTGHLLGGAGGLEAGVTVLALRDQILPPTVNLENQDPDTAGMDFIPNHARKASFEYALSNSFGFGGTNGALLFRRWAE